MNTATAPRRTTASAPAAYASPQPAKRLAHGLMTMLLGMAGGIARLLNRRAVRQQLYEMPDYQLADMGLSRGEIGQVFDRNFRSVEHRAVPEHSAGGHNAQMHAELERRAPPLNVR